jgi:hypothetical protein
VGVLSLSLDFELFLTLICHFAWFAVFVPFTGFAVFPSSR